MIAQSNDNSDCTTEQHRAFFARLQAYLKANLLLSGQRPNSENARKTIEQAAHFKFEEMDTDRDKV